VAPGKKDVITIKSADDLKTEVQKRYLIMKVREASSSSFDCEQRRFAGDNNFVPFFSVRSSLSDLVSCWWFVVVDQSCDVIRII
jgi:hypothetical protein